MTVEELKAVFDELPDGCVVKIMDYDGEYVDVEKIKLIKTFTQTGAEEVVEIHY